VSDDGIQGAVDEALAALDASPDGWLGLPDRRRLRAAFGPWTPPYEPGGPDAGLLRRAALQVECVRRAASSWERRFPGDARPRELAAAVMPALRGELPEERVKALAAELEQDVEPLGAEADAEDGAFFAGLAAVYLSTEAWDGDLDPEGYPPERTDQELDEPLAEALAASALAADELEDSRSFWRWYVTEAFPAAYAAAP
jgi:Immunity protein Imm5